MRGHFSATMFSLGILLLASCTMPTDAPPPETETLGTPILSSARPQCPSDHPKCRDEGDPSGFDEYFAPLELTGNATTAGPITMKGRDTSHRLGGQNQNYTEDIHFSFDTSTCGVYPASSPQSVIDGLKLLLSEGTTQHGWISFSVDKDLMQPGDSGVENGGRLLLYEQDDRYSISYEGDKIPETPNYHVSWAVVEGEDVITFDGHILAFDNLSGIRGAQNRPRIFCEGSVTLTISR